MLRLQPTCEIEQQALAGLHVGGLIRSPQDGLRPRAITIAEVVEDVAHLVHLAALHECRLAEGGAHRFPQCLRAVEDDEQTPVRAEATALQIREEILTDPRVLRRAVPHAERMFVAIRRDPKRHDQAMLTDVHAVDNQADQVERLERRGLPCRQLRGRLRHKATTHRALARAPASHRCRHRLQTPRVAPRGNAHEHLLDNAPIQRIDIGHGLERRQRHLPALGPHARAPHGHLAAAQHVFAAHGSGP